MPSANRQPVDISGLVDEFKKQDVSLTKCLAGALKKLEILSEDTEPTKAKQFQATVAMGLIRACAQTMKARPELVGKSAGSVSGADLMASAVSDTGEAGIGPAAATQRPQPAPTLLRMPRREDTGNY